MHPAELANIEIDHIIPRSNFLEGAAVYGLPTPPDFDVHDVENLAPICHTCNRTKRERVYPKEGLAQVAHALSEARKLADRVRRRFDDYLSVEGLEEAVLRIVMTPEGEDHSQAFEDLTRLLVQRLHDIGLSPERHYVEEIRAETEETIVADWPVVSDGDLRLGLLSIPLDFDGRFARRVVEELFTLDFAQLIVDAVEAVKEALRAKASQLSGSENCDFSAMPDLFVPAISRVVIDGDIDEAQLYLVGTVEEADLGTAVFTSDDGADLDDRQLVATYSGSYSVTVQLLDPTDLEIDLASVEVVVEIA